MSDIVEDIELEGEAVLRLKYDSKIAKATTTPESVH